MDTRTSVIPGRLARLRDAMARNGVDAVLVPSADPHLSEYLPARWQAREHFSGFTGSMGTLVVLRNRAVVFADSRYWEQAAHELDGTGIHLEKINTGAAAAHVDWLAANLPAGTTLAVDGAVLALGAATALRTALDARGVRLRTDVDLVGESWPGREALPTAPIYEHVAPHATVGRAAKLDQVRDAMARAGATHHLVSTVDDIAWLTNLRGTDVPYNPVFLAHLLLAPTGATLFLGAGKADPALAARLAADGVAIAPYDDARAALQALPGGAVLLVDPRRVTLGLREAVPDGVRVVEQINPSTLAKSRKSDADAALIRAAMVEDGIAMCAFYARFEAALARGEPLSELTVDEWLSAERAKRPGFVGLSFPTIAGFAANGALPHYRATPAAYAPIAGNGLLLIDSGGQYLGGTTDITRVWPVGTVDGAIRRDVTLVLQGMIALSRTVFPQGTLAPMLDAIARAPMWAHGLDYGHGTGHGVGHFLNVHEGPQSISRAIPDASMAMQPGMITSIEPGIYRPGRWGVRIENLVRNVPMATPENDAFGAMLRFDTLTLCPIDTRTLERSMLRADEIAWLDDYHRAVREALEPQLDGAPKAWLLERTQPV